jgi:hypothetical protein
VQQLVDDN